MGNNNSVEKKLTNEEILANIYKFFNNNTQTTSETSVLSLHLENETSGGCLAPCQNRYHELEIQLGGKLEHIHALNNINNFFHQSGGEADSDISDLDIGDLEEDIVEEQQGGKYSETSNNFMSEILKLDVLSATSQDKCMLGGCGCETKKEEPKSTSPITTLSLNKFSDKVQTGGCPMCANKQSSEEINIIPFFSSTSGTEYYNAMQKEQRYN